MAAPSDQVFFSDLPADVDDVQLQSIFGAYGNISSVKVIPGQGKNSALVRFGTVEEAQWIVENLNGNLAQGLATPVQVRYASDSPPGKGGGGGGGGWGGGGGGKDGGSWGGKEGGGGGGGWGGKSDRWSPYDGKGGGGGGGGWSPKGGGGKGGIRILKKGLLLAGVLPGGKWTNDENALFVGGLPSDTQDVDLYEIFSPFGSIPSGGVKAMMNQDGAGCRGIGFVNFLDASSAQNAIATLHGTMMPDGTTLKVCVKGAPGQRSGEGKGKGK